MTKHKKYQKGKFVQNFIVRYSYPVFFTENLFDIKNPLLSSFFINYPQCERRLIVYVDDGVINADHIFLQKLTAWVEHHNKDINVVIPPEVVPGGERTKNGWNVVQNIMSQIGSKHLCRHSFVVIIGGGSVLDMVGFAASLVHRGLRIVRIPTTTLAQCDAGVGVKTGMDEHGMKNFVGTFAPPSAVFIDFSFLKTLERKYLIGGLAEAVKVAIIKDKAFFSFLCKNAAKIGREDYHIISSVVKKTALLHLCHIRDSGDPFEFGAARPLDFGHWSAHQLEILSNYEVTHGEAVGIGIALDSLLANKLGIISQNELLLIFSTLKKMGLPLWHNSMEIVSENGKFLLLKGLDVFREHLGGELNITLPDGIGKKVEIHSVDTAIVETCIHELKQYYYRGGRFQC